MTTPAIVPNQIEQAIRELPPLAQVELAQFIDYLRYKYVDSGSTVLALEGLWADVDFDVSQEDVRQLREDVSSKLIARFEHHELSTGTNGAG